MAKLRDDVRELRQWCLGRAHEFALLSVRRNIYMDIAGRLNTIISSTDPGEWKGPWRCSKCSKVWSTKITAHYEGWGNVPYPRELCDGILVPYERRQT